MRLNRGARRFIFARPSRGRGQARGALLVLLLAGCAASTPLDRGDARYAAGDFRRAVGAYTEAIEADPTDAAAYNNRANARIKLGDFPGAVADYTRALELSPEDPEIYVNRGNAYLAGGDLAAAVADYTRTLEQNRESPRAAYNRGVALERQGDLAGAVEDYRRALELESDPAVEAKIRAVIERLVGGPAPVAAVPSRDGGEGDARHPSQAPPKPPARTPEADPHALASRALTRELQGDHDGALRDLRNALRLEQDPERKAELRQFLKFLEQSR